MGNNFLKHSQEIHPLAIQQAFHRGKVHFQKHKELPDLVSAAVYLHVLGLHTVQLNPIVSSALDLSIESCNYIPIRKVRAGSGLTAGTGNVP